DLRAAAASRCAMPPASDGGVSPGHRAQRPLARRSAKGFRRRAWMGRKPVSRSLSAPERRSRVDDVRLRLRAQYSAPEAGGLRRDIAGAGLTARAFARCAIAKT